MTELSETVFHGSLLPRISACFTLSAHHMLLQAPATNGPSMTLPFKAWRALLGRASQALLPDKRDCPYLVASESRNRTAQIDFIALK